MRQRLNAMPPTFDQPAFIEAIGAVAIMIAHACAIVSRGGSNNLQRLEAHHPPAVRGGGDSLTRSMVIEREVDDARSIRDAGVSGLVLEVETSGKADTCKFSPKS